MPQLKLFEGRRSKTGFFIDFFFEIKSILVQTQLVWIVKWSINFSVWSLLTANEAKKIFSLIYIQMNQCIGIKWFTLINSILLTSNKNTSGKYLGKYKTSTFCPQTITTTSFWIFICLFLYLLLTVIFLFYFSR